MRHILYVIAVVDSVFLGVCGCLLLFPSGRSSLAGIGFSPARISDSGFFAPASAVSDQPGPGGSSFQVETGKPAPYSIASAGDHPAAPAGGGVTLVAASVSGDIDPPEQEQQYASAANRASYMQSVGSYASYTPPSATSSTYDGSAERCAPGAAESNAAPRQAGPLEAFTASPDGGTPTRAPALDRLQHQIASQVASSEQDPVDPGYAEAWDAVQTSNDWNYAQQFGWQGFVEAGVVQFHGGAN